MVCCGRSVVVVAGVWCCCRRLASGECRKWGVRWAGRECWRVVAVAVVIADVDCCWCDLHVIVAVTASYVRSFVPCFPSLCPFYFFLLGFPHTIPHHPLTIPHHPSPSLPPSLTIPFPPPSPSPLLPLLVVVIDYQAALAEVPLAPNRFRHPRPPKCAPPAVPWCCLLHAHTRGQPYTWSHTVTHTHTWSTIHVATQ